MANLIIALSCASGVFWACSVYYRLNANIAAVKRSGLPYKVIPIGNYHPVWLTLCMVVTPILRRLPKSWTSNWIDFVLPDWCWRLLYKPFAEIGDSFFLVSYDSIFFFTSDAGAINQIVSRREAFPRPVESYTLLNVFGRNLVSTEGEVWKRHRKIISPNINEKNNALVFSESIHEAQQMLNKWIEKKGQTIKDVSEDMMRMTLHIITRVGFGVKLYWPGSETEEQTKLDNELGEGHSMSFAKSIDVTLSNLLFVFLAPMWLIKYLPVKRLRLIYKSFANFKKYINEMLEEKIKQTREGKATKGMDILGALVRSSYSTSEPNSREGSPARADKGLIDKPILTDAEILGNAFVMLFAGHETTANSIQFSLIELAINPKPQKEAQKQIQDVLGDKTPQTWDYETYINTLLGSILGAIMNEQLRLMPPEPNIPKRVSKKQDQEIIIDGKKVTLPAGANIGINVNGVQRNPRYWPTGPSDINEGHNDLDDFKPERWVVTAGTTGNCSSAGSQDEEDFGGDTGRDSSAGLFRPVTGSYIPFSAGAHSCLGRRLAQIEIIVVLAVIFQKYSIELAVDEWASDEEVQKMNREERRALYKKAQIKARETLRSADLKLTLTLSHKFVPLRLVKKGDEKFFDLFD